jgi:periplasmic copper chaperone A
MSLAQRLLACLALGAAALGPIAAGAEEFRAGDIVVADPWARETLGNVRESAVFLVLKATGDRPDRLVRAETPAAAAAELQSDRLDGDIIQMRPIAAIEIRPGTPTVLQPGGLHIMLVDLKAALRAGARVPLTLVFERAGRLDISVPVVRRASSRPDQSGNAVPTHQGPTNQSPTHQSS